MAIQSPFPGMDPYLKKHWEDVRQSLVTYPAILSRDSCRGA